MKTSKNFIAWKLIPLIVIFLFVNYALVAQVDTTVVKTDTIPPVPIDTVKVDTTTTTTAVPAETTEPATKSTKSSQFIIYGGGNSNQLGGDLSNFDVGSGFGYHLGVAWKKGNFLYWQIGARYNSAVYDFRSKITSKDTGNLTVSALDVPLTAGINFLSFAKIVSLRLFISAVPSFTLGVNDNQFGIKEEDVQSFLFYGQIGIGASISALMLDVGYNYGFEGLLENNSNTNPGQVFVSLGISF